MHLPNGDGDVYLTLESCIELHVALKHLVVQEILGIKRKKEKQVIRSRKVRPTEGKPRTKENVLLGVLKYSQTRFEKQ